jgi:AbrB family looped-hinge helix DNA binding protein
VGEAAMDTTLAKVLSKFRVVIPDAIRKHLSLGAGDFVRFRLDTEGVVVLENDKTASDGPFAIFSEWNSGEDDHLYRNL